MGLEKDLKFGAVLEGWDGKSGADGVEDHMGRESSISTSFLTSIIQYSEA